MQDEFLDWINKNYDFVIKKLDSNKNTWQELLDELKNTKAILEPRSAYELAQVKFEYDKTKKCLRYYQKEDVLTISKDELHKLNQLLDGGIVMLNNIIEVDFNNGGNLAIFIESMAKEIPIDSDMVNISENMIDIDFKQHSELAIDEITSVSWDITTKEFNMLMDLYKKQLETRDANNYSFDEFLSDVYATFLENLVDGKLELMLQEK